MEITYSVSGKNCEPSTDGSGAVLRVRASPVPPLEVRQAPAAAALSAAAPERASPPGADRPYSAWSSLRPRYWLPNGYALDGALALGFATDGQDALGLHQYALAPLFEFTQHQALGSATYVYDNRHGVLLNRW